MSKITKTYELKTLTSTKKIACKFAQLALKHSSNSPYIIFLDGSLGTGKTTFCQFFIRDLIDKNLSVSSPTFNLLNLYQSATSNLSICHMDLYRIEQFEEIANLALDQYFEANYIWLVEWASKASQALPKHTLKIKLTFNNLNNLKHRIATIYF